MLEFHDQVRAAIRRHRLLRRGETVVVAVSGGVDSMVLLHVLHALATDQGWILVVAHLHHGLRGRSADADEAFVRRAAQACGCAFVGERAEVRRRARETGASVEMAARELRHAFLARVARQFRARSVALAHHADDQVETFLLRLFRGTSGEGLASMQWRSRSPAAMDLRLVRPLLGHARAELRAYAQGHGVKWREDASNTTLDFARNRLRHRVIPELRRHFQPALTTTLLRVMDLVGAEAEAVAEAARRWRRDRQQQTFDSLPVAVQRRVLHSQLIGLRIAPTFELVERLRVKPETACSVGPGWVVWHDAAGRIRRRRTREPGFDPTRREMALRGRCGGLEFGGLALRWRIEARPGCARVEAREGRECFDADRVGRQVILRHWQAGDRFWPIGARGPVKLQDLFTNAQVPRGERRRRVVAATADGTVFWVEGLRMAEPFKIEQNSRRWLIWQWGRT